MKSLELHNLNIRRQCLYLIMNHYHYLIVYSVQDIKMTI